MVEYFGEGEIFPIRLPFLVFDFYVSLNKFSPSQYFSKDIKGNTYLIESKNGILDNTNPDIIYLVDVKAKISFDENEEIMTLKQVNLNEF